MNRISKQWYQYAHADLDAAQRLFHTPRPTRWTHLLVLWHCHQAIEKTLKAVMVQQNKEILKIHDLPRLAQLTELVFTKHHQQTIDKLNKFYLRSRYPDIASAPLPHPDNASTKTLLTETGKLFLWLEQQ